MLYHSHGLIIRLSILWILVLGISRATGDDRPLLHWNFDDLANTDWRYGEDMPTLHTEECISETDCNVQGLARCVPGVSGKALKLDGFTTFVEAVPKRSQSGDHRSDGLQVRLPRSITIEAWVALASYPWNWAPILSIGNYKITGFYFGVDSRGRVGFHVSDGTSVWHECNSAINPETKLGLELNKWYHVVGTYSPRDGLKVYVDGELAGVYDDFQFDYGIVYSHLREGFRIGQNKIDLPPTDPIRDWATYPSRYSLDGIIDELKVYRGAMTGDTISRIYRDTTPESEPKLSSRKFPTVPSSGRFGAHYTRLKYYPEWDALWPPGDDVDVVVQFEDVPTKIMFWRGTRYSPCWVSENGKWMADQSRETGNNWFLSQGSRDEMPTGCIEHMSDTQCRSSRVQIIENNDARCVVNWRYLQMDVKFRQRDIPIGSGFGEWGSEYYYIYPDGVAVRAVDPGYGGWQETIFLNEPGTRPEDNVELEACTLVTLQGESKSFSWEHGYPEFDLDGAVIQMTNFKSQFKPFLIFREGGGFDVFNLEVRPEYSHFPWWNHWPVAQILSDGRSASAPDRASHSSLSWGNPNSNAALYGMTDQPPESLVALARSWNFPPEVTVDSDGYVNHGYDFKQRAYVLESEAGATPLDLNIAATADSPMVNLALVIENWDKDVSLEIEDQLVSPGKAFRYAIEYDISGDARLIVWIDKSSEQSTQIKLAPTN